jgi:hypothetical protein
MVNLQMNWQEYGDGTAQLSNSAVESELIPINEESPGNGCLPLQLNYLSAKLSLKIKICQVCNYEL